MPTPKEIFTVDDKIEEAKIEVTNMINGMTRVILMTGPPGIAKSATTRFMLEVNNEIERQKWLLMPPSARPFHRRSKVVGGKWVFRSTYGLIVGGMSAAAAYQELYWHSEFGEILWMDDVTALYDKEIQGYIMGGYDNTHNGYVVRRVRGIIPDDIHQTESIDKQVNVFGGIIIIHNYEEGSEGGIAVKKILRGGLLSRAGIIDFPWDRPALASYVRRKGFTRQIYEYLTSPTLAQLHAAGKRPKEDSVGLGFGLDEKGNPLPDPHGKIAAEAKAMMRDVRDYFDENWDRIPEVSFREVQKMLRMRLTNPTRWTHVLDSKLHKTKQK